jgi:hypothetical protein
MPAYAVAVPVVKRPNTAAALRRLEEQVEAGVAT